VEKLVSCVLVTSFETGLKGAHDYIASTRTVLLYLVPSWHLEISNTNKQDIWRSSWKQGEGITLIAVVLEKSNREFI